MGCASCLTALEWYFLTLSTLVVPISDIVSVKLDRDTLAIVEEANLMLWEEGAEQNRTLRASLRKARSLQARSPKTASAVTPFRVLDSQ